MEWDIPTQQRNAQRSSGDQRRPQRLIYRRSRASSQVFYPNLPTKPTKRAGQHEWGERFSLPARSETILRFELKRKTSLRHQSLTFAGAPISDLLVNRQHWR
ncbi:hypothetical protein L210DRAFT_2785797 [Boletus edulis BED1]|uniref:Uncharacterized protein n=1 Tax=Boletus edulis BED1 TaxID=1328754 RepID=A0AAD4GIY4_BOLED|nr:hypothetical protein L210DRAFT_2785797 [Boletus edulis BED1]